MYLIRLKAAHQLEVGHHQFIIDRLATLSFEINHFLKQLIFHLREIIQPLNHILEIVLHKLLLY